MQREMALGFRSSFNFIPEGEYKVPSELRAEILTNGFEVGIHDLVHDGHLFDTARHFQKHAVTINRYLHEWGATGFRAGFMLRNLDWFHQLDIDYDASTFDTDPFEPQPEGTHTIFPFWVHRRPSMAPASRDGYVELPYTLPQDSTLFLLLRETSINIWKNKLDWIAQHGGMVLLNTHPDYMAMNGAAPGNDQFPVQWYEELLEYVRSKYSGQYWHALPREVAALVREREKPPLEEMRSPSGAPTHRLSERPAIWIDLDNTPHVPFFAPIIRELEKRGYSILLTARDAFQVCELADRHRLAYLRVGKHHGRSKFRKVLGLMQRAFQLAGSVLHSKPLLALSHGSRAQLMLAGSLRIPSLLIDDYEHSRYPLTMKPDWMLVPQVIPPETLPVKADRVRTYPGIKEDVYASGLLPDASVIEELGIAPHEIIVVARPPAIEAHYHNPESEGIFAAFMDRACAAKGVRVVLLPRNNGQRLALEQRHPSWFRDSRTIIPAKAVDGLNLLWHSDLVAGGGGTMNREAAALGVPVFSLFRGAPGAVDRHLNAEGRLHFITSVNDVPGIPIVRRVRPDANVTPCRRTLLSIVETIEQIASLCRRSRRHFHPIPA